MTASLERLSPPDEKKVITSFAATTNTNFTEAEAEKARTNLRERLGHLRQVAWSPGRKPIQLQIGAVLVHPDQRLDREIYFHCLTDRIQAMIDAAEEPLALVREAERHLVDVGLLHPAVSPKQPHEAGNLFVLSNPLVWEHLGQYLALRNLKEQKPVEMREARAELQADVEEPEQRLLQWVSAIS